MSLALTVLTFFAGLGVGQTDLKRFITVVKNAARAPVLVIPFADGPGFTIRNVSQRAVTHIRLGCVAPETIKDKAAKVRFDMGKDLFTLDSSGPHSQRQFEGFTPEQSMCSHRGAAITVLEVVFDNGKNWRFPHQVADHNYTDDRQGNGDNIIR